MTQQPLDLLQLWMKTVITERGGLPEKLESAAQQHGLIIEDVVAEKRGLSSRKRLSIYTSGYVARLVDCMRADFPLLRRFVGDSVFDAFAKAYIVTEPPHSPSLFDLGARFPHFLEETKPQNDEALLDLPAEIARFERARTEVMRARGTEDDSARPSSLAGGLAALPNRDRCLGATPPSEHRRTLRIRHRGGRAFLYHAPVGRRQSCYAPGLRRQDCRRGFSGTAAIG